jgi:FkbM family methyltransferase
LKVKSKTAVKSLFRSFGVDVALHKEPGPKDDLTNVFNEVRRLRDFGQEAPGTADNLFLNYCAENHAQSKAQLFQDLFVLHELQDLKSGFFVEFGATNGITLSNTYLLEKAFGWKGILAEPAVVWHERLRQNRSCVLDTRCLWSESGKVLQFDEVPEAELSTIRSFADGDTHSSSRKNAQHYDVHTITLDDLLATHDAPKTIDFLSVDTEGSEFAILKAFDFSKHDVRIITVEHNYTSAREDIYALLTDKGFIRKFEHFSQWDDWYVAR